MVELLRKKYSRKDSMYLYWYRHSRKARRASSMVAGLSSIPATERFSEVQEAANRTDCVLKYSTAPWTPTVSTGGVIRRLTDNNPRHPQRRIVMRIAGKGNFPEAKN